MTEPKSVVLPITPRGIGREFSKLMKVAEGRFASKNTFSAGLLPQKSAGLANL